MSSNRPTRTQQQHERASRIANAVPFESPWTVFPLVVFFALIVLASTVYAMPTAKHIGAPSVVITGIVLIAWVRIAKEIDPLIRYIPTEALGRGIDLVSAGSLIVSWLVYGLAMRHTTQFVPSWVIVSGGVASTGLVFSTYFKEVYTKKPVRKAMGLLTLICVLMLPSTANVAFDMHWSAIFVKMTLFFSLYILTETESRSLNVPSGDIYYRSEERRIVQSGWVLMAPWFLVVLCGVPQIAYLVVTIRKRHRKQRLKRGDTAAHPTVQMASMAIRNTQLGNSPGLKDIEDVIDVDTIVVTDRALNSDEYNTDSMEDDEAYSSFDGDVEQGQESSFDSDFDHEHPRKDLAGVEVGKVSKDLQSSVSVVVETHRSRELPAHAGKDVPVITLAPGSSIPDGAIPVPVHVPIYTPQSHWESSLMSGSSASRVSGIGGRGQPNGTRRVPKPFGARLSRKPRTRLGANVRGADVN